MNQINLIDNNIQKLEEFKKLSNSDIYNRCNLIKFKDIETNNNENEIIIEDIQGVLGFKEWESLIDRSNNMILMLSRFMKFITNPRKINR